MTWLEELLNLLFPPRPVCPLCGEMSAGAEICAGCRQKITRFRQSRRCFRCGRLQAAAAGRGWPRQNKAGRILCPECFNGEHCFTLARSAGPYDGVLKDAVHRFKFGKKRYLAGSLGGLLADVVREILALAGGKPVETERSEAGGLLTPSPPAALVPVPLSRLRLEERGFNQSALLAREVAALTGLPVWPVLQKIRETPPQAGLSRESRKINLSGAFAVRSASKNPVSFPAGRSFVLIDDVFTTGFTADECARALLSAGAKDVYVATLAAGHL